MNGGDDGPSTAGQCPESVQQIQGSGGVQAGCRLRGMGDKIRIEPQILVFFLVPESQS